MGQQLLAVVAEGHRQRVYLPATDDHVRTAGMSRPADVPEAELADEPRALWCVNYGLRTFADLFTNRQLVALTTFSDLVTEARARCEADAQIAGMTKVDATAYAAALTTNLAFLVSKLSDLANSLCGWKPVAQCPRHLFSRQAIPMVWDYAEGNPLSSSSGSWSILINNQTRSLTSLLGYVAGPVGSAKAAEATTRTYRDVVVSTDPPYYDNIGYADLSDFFYVWLRRSLHDLYPDLLSTLLTPKVDELIASPYRFGGSKVKAEEHFETGFVRAFTRIRESHPPNVPITVFYAFKQGESDEGGVASTGWETMLNGLFAAGLTVTATWPIRSEMGSRMVAQGTNALASSIVLACRPRLAAAEATTRRGFLQALKAELPTALRELQQGSIAPVDLAQAAVGPG